MVCAQTVAASPDLDAVLAAHRQMLAEGRIQTSLPDPPPPPPPPGWLKWLEPLLPYVKYVLWAGAAVVALIIVREIWRWARGRDWRRRPTEVEAPGWRPDAEQARELLAEADALAAAGRFGEAAHLILLKSVEQIAARDPMLVRASLTSRDIAALPGLAGAVAAAFGDIAGRVERWLFAGRDLDAGDWQQCRASYAALAT